MRIDDAKILIEKDSYLLGLLKQIDVSPFKPRRRYKRNPGTAFNLAFDHFWVGINGLRFRAHLENKYGFNILNSRIPGVIKIAARLVLQELQGGKNDD
jgi:hypothetical protein